MSSAPPSLPWRDRLARSGAWYLLPVLVPQLIVAWSLPDAATLFTDLDLSAMASMAVALVLFVWPFFFVVQVDDTRGRAGLALYLLGILGTVGGRMLAVLSGTLALSMACPAGLMAELSPPLVFAGIGIMGRERTYLGLVGVFALLGLITELGRGVCLA